MVKVVFENPLDKNSPFLILKDYAISPKKILLKTPPVAGVKPNHTYSVDIKLYNRGDLNNPIDCLDNQYINSGNVSSDLSGSLIFCR